MNKTELVSHIAEQHNCSKVEAEKAINLFTTGVAGAIGAGNDISLIGFGSFSINEVKARTGINPKTKESLQIPAYKQVRFKVGSNLKQSANGKGASGSTAGKQEKANNKDESNGGSKSKDKAKNNTNSKSK